MTDWAAEAVTRGEVLVYGIWYWIVFVYGYKAPDPHNNRP